MKMAILFDRDEGIVLAQYWKLPETWTLMQIVRFLEANDLKVDKINFEKMKAAKKAQARKNRRKTP